jgi:Trk K+ transport system NAD-binding subunit
VEAEPEARGIPLARRLHVPTVIGDVTQEGVLEAAKIDRAHALLAVTSSDTTNLEAALYARSVQPALRVSLRLHDDAFATAVYRTLRAAHPRALTRNVSTITAPAFAGAMMSRRILGAIPVERRVLVFAALDVAGHPQLEGHTVAESFRPGTWRVLAIDSATPDERLPDLAASPSDDGTEHPNGLLEPAPRLRPAPAGPRGPRRPPPPGTGRTPGHPPADPPTPHGRMTPSQLPLHAVDLRLIAALRCGRQRRSR